MTLHINGVYLTPDWAVVQGLGITALLWVLALWHTGWFVWLIWEATGCKRTVHQVSRADVISKQLKNMFGNRLTPIFEILAKDGFNEYLDYYKKLSF